MPAGRPPIFETPEQLEKAIEAYFDAKPKVTITGLALHLGFCDRQSLYDYEEKEQYSCIIKKARLRVECAYEENLATGTPTGSIFALKNMGWKDKHETEPGHYRCHYCKRESETMERPLGWGRLLCSVCDAYVCSRCMRPEEIADQI